MSKRPSFEPRETILSRAVGNMDKYPYPLYFEARELTAKERKKITKKFNKIWRRDCCCIEKVGDKSYKICFKKQEGKRNSPE